MSQAFHRRFRAVLTALAFMTFLVLLGGNVWSQQAPSTDPGLIRREWRLVGVYVGETWRKRDNLGANGFIEITGANTKSGTAKIEVRSTRGILFRQRFSWIFLQDMSVMKADQRCGVQFRLEGDRPTTNGNMAEFFVSEGAEPGLWKLYFPEILKGPWMVSRGNYSNGNRVVIAIDDINYPRSIPSSQAEFWIPGENADSASVSRFADIWFTVGNANGDYRGMDQVEIHYLFVAAAKTADGASAAPPALAPPTTGLPAGVTFLPPSSGPGTTPLPVPPTTTGTPPVTPPVTPPHTPPPPVPPTGPGSVPASPLDEPFATPQGQRCIQEWLDLAVRILNERLPDRGPWRFNQYGILENRSVTSAMSPEGWMATYQGDRYLYVWVNWERAHESLDYGGRLPQLRAYVTDCVSRGSPGRSGGDVIIDRRPGANSTPPNTPGGTSAGPGQSEPFPADRMTLQAGRRTVREGETLMVPVWLIKASGVADMNFNVRYDPAVARAKDPASKGNLLDRASFECNTAESGLVRVGFAQTADLSGTGTVVQIPFTATGAVGSRTALRLEVTTISNTRNQRPAIATIDGEIVVVGPLGRLPGDSDGDNDLTARDYANALKMSVRLIPIDLVCDMDKDGQVTSTDARLIAATILNAR